MSFKIQQITTSWINEHSKSDETVNEIVTDEERKMKEKITKLVSKLASSTFFMIFNPKILESPK